MPIRLLDTPEAARAWSQALHAEGRTFALVPTMGALHAGHLSLVEQARAYVDAIMVSIFVNPTQFGPGEDFSRYPHTPKQDIALLEAAHVEALYMPQASLMYPEGFATHIDIGPLGNDLCGEFRPGHFNGVATVVAKLLLQTSPDAAAFGKKDYQQFVVLKRLVADLNVPVTLLGGEIVREDDGMALSSRNRYLTPEERCIAPVLYRIMQETAAQLKQGHHTTPVMEQAKARLIEAGFRSIDYFELRDGQTLEKLKRPTENSRILAAVHLGQTRLIDNIEVMQK